MESCQSLSESPTCCSSSQEQSQNLSQTSAPFSFEPPGLPFPFVEGGDPAAKFSFDCSFFRRTKRELLANGWDEGQIFGRGEVDVDSILMGLNDPYMGQSVPTWASRTVCKMLPTLPLPIQLASACLLTKMMRWMIWPSVENMNDQPEWLMPLARQDCTPYDILVDLIPWPALRQYLYTHPNEFVAGAFLGHVNIEWPFPPEACHYWDMEAGCTRLTPAFESYVADLNNWTMDAKALQIMPALIGMVPIKTG